MSGEQVAKYVKSLRMLSREMANSAEFIKRRDVYVLTHAETGEPVSNFERHYSLFYENSQQWALALSVGNPVILGMADHILNTVDGAVE